MFPQWQDTNSIQAPIDYKPGTLEHIQGLKTKVCEAGHPKSVLCDNLEGWGGEGDGRGFQMEGTPITKLYLCITKSSQYCKVIILQLK